MKIHHICSLLMCLFLVAQPALCQTDASENNTAGNIALLEQLQEQLEQIRSDYETRISELERKIEDLSATREEDEPTAIRREAEEECVGLDSEDIETAPEDTCFNSGALGLQALNPEISLVGDVVASYGDTEGDPKNSNFDFRCMAVHFESYLDPYSRLKACVPITNNWTKLGEAYFTRFDLFNDINFTLGKFNQQFGVVNRWHQPGLDQVNYPLPIINFFGGSPLNQTGASFDWLLPDTWLGCQELTFQVTDGDNDRLFGQNNSNFPASLLHYKNYRDLSQNTYLELGLTGLAGQNEEWLIQPVGGSPFTQSEDLWTTMLGADLTLLWEPTDAMRYRNFVWRTEGYYLNKKLLAPDGSGRDSIRAWGAYSYLQQKISRTTDIGLRFDYFEPDTKAYASTTGAYYPLAVTEPDAHQWRISPYITWWQSPWVKWRFQFDHMRGTGLPDDDRFFIQCVFSAGPHKHERY